ncbi:MAG: hypothetical protein ACTSQG_12005, partial [Promethearchaeota archaeon]
KTLFLYLVIAVPVIIVLFVYPRTIIGLIYGEQYLSAESIIGYFALVMYIFGLIRTFIYVLLAIDSKSFLFCIVPFAFIESIFIILFHSTFQQVLLILGVCGIFSLLSLFLYFVRLMYRT